MDTEIVDMQEQITGNRHYDAAKLFATTYLTSLDEGVATEEEEEASISHLQKITRQARAKAQLVGNDIYALLEMAEMHYKNRWKMDTFELLMVTFCLAYVAAPLDAVPDMLPSIGLADDAMVVAFAVETLRDNIVRFRAWKDSNVSDYQEGKEEVVCQTASCVIL